jgi:PAS domain S-box-containing protein
VLAETYTRALDQTADSVVITNRDGVIQYVNLAFENMTGFTREEAIGQTPRLVRSGVATPQFYETLWNTILSGRAFRTTITNRREDGRLFEQEQTITPIDASGTITHFISTGRDITHRQQSAVARVQRLLELEEARTAGLVQDEAGQFLALAHLTLAGIAHGLG